MTDLIVGDDGLARPVWATSDPLMQDYYDHEWGLPVKEEQALFERLSLEGFQAGLSWRTVLHKRQALRLAFADFNPHKVAHYDEKKIQDLLGNAEIIRHKGKITATITNAQAVLKLRENQGLVDFIWSYQPHSTPQPYTLEEIPTQSPESHALSRALKKKGFRFVGPTTVYAMMEAIGMVDTHLMHSHRRGSSGIWK